MGAVAPVSKARTKTSTSSAPLSNVTTFIPDSRLSSARVFSVLNPRPCLWDVSWSLAACSLISHICTLAFFVSSFDGVRDSICWERPQILFLIQKQIHISLQTFFPPFYSTKHTAVRNSPLTLITVTTSVEQELKLIFFPQNNTSDGPSLTEIGQKFSIQM